MHKVVGLLLLTSLLSFGQTRKEFDVASIRPSAAQQNQAVVAGLQVDGSQVHVSYLSLRDYIAMAYRLGVNQVVGPDWLDLQRFDISAKLPDGGKQSDVNEMLQSLLSDRFRMKAHREMKEFPVYVLEVAPSGLKVTETAPESAFAESQALKVGAGGNSTGVSIDYGNGSTFALATTTLETKKLTMEMFCNLLTRFMDRQVVDKTKLKAGYDLTLSLTPEDRNVMLIRSAVAAGVVLPAQAMALLNTPFGNSLTEALKKNGLLLESRKAPLDVLVVDEMQKTPTEN